MSADRKRDWKTWLTALLIVPLAVVLLPVVLLWAVGLLFLKLLLVIVVWTLWSPRGIDTLLVYSRSPHWMDYFESGLIPRIRSRSVVLNWSDRAQWSRLSIAVLLFQSFKGPRSFNPMVLVFKPLRWPQSFRFYEAFRDLKHGKPDPLHQLEAQLASELGVQ